MKEPYDRYNFKLDEFEEVPQPKKPERPKKIVKPKPERINVNQLLDEEEESYAHIPVQEITIMEKPETKEAQRLLKEASLKYNYSCFLPALVALVLAVVLGVTQANIFITIFVPIGAIIIGGAICVGIREDFLRPYRDLLEVAKLNDKIRHEERIRHRERQRLMRGEQ